MQAMHKKVQLFTLTVHITPLIANRQTTQKNMDEWRHAGIYNFA